MPGAVVTTRLSLGVVWRYRRYVVQVKKHLVRGTRNVITAQPIPAVQAKNSVCQRRQLLTPSFASAIPQYQGAANILSVPSGSLRSSKTFPADPLVLSLYGCCTALLRRRGAPPPALWGQQRLMETITMQDNTVTLTGNLTDEPEVRFTGSGTAVANFTIASTSRTFDKATNEWRNGDTLFMRCTVWQQSAEHLADSLTKGTRVIVVGRLRQRSFETRDGEKRTTVELQVDEIGVSLRYAIATVTKTAKGNSSDSTTEQQPA